MRLSDEDKVDVEKIKSELLTEYEIERMDREQAVVEFANRSRLINEPAKSYAYKLQQLASLAYPDFDNAAQDVIVKDTYVRGIHPNLQLQLLTRKVRDSRCQCFSSGNQPFGSSWRTTYAHVPMTILMRWIKDSQQQAKIPSTKHSSKLLMILLRRN